MHKGVGSLVFGNYLATYYGALKNNNAGEYNPDRIPEIEENPLINATAYNRIASLYDHLFKWVDRMNLGGRKKDVVEIVIIGVGGNTSSKRNWEGDVILSTGFSPQVVEILAVLSELKNLKVNLTLIDKNEQSLDSATDLEKYDVSLLLDNAVCWEQDVSTRLLQCLRNICPAEKLESKQLSASRNKLRHIKINTYCVDIREMVFPKMKADIIISTHVFPYLFKADDSLLAQNFLMQLTQSLAPHGQLMMSDSYTRFFYSAWHIVLQLPEDTNCKNYNVYLQFNRENNSVDYCFFSEQEEKVIRGTLYYDQAAYIKDARRLSPGVYSSPPRIIDEQILAIYENHNLFYKNEPNPYSANRSIPMSQACLFSLFCSSGNENSHFTYKTTGNNEVTVVTNCPKSNCP